MKKGKKGARSFRLRAGLSALFFICSIYAVEPEMAVPCFLAAAFHECGHLLMAKLLGIELKELRLDLFGAQLSVSTPSIPYTYEFLLCAAGPLFSLLLSLLHHFAYASSFVSELSSASLFLGLLNLIPVRGFDGGRMLHAFVSLVANPFVADLLERFITGMFLIFLWGISVYLMLLSGGGLTLFVFVVGFFCKIFLS